MTASVYLDWTDASGLNRRLYFDIATTVGIEQTQAITDNPVEKGANVTDHSRTQPDEVTYDVMVTNAPIDDLPDGSRQMHKGRVTLASARYLTAGGGAGFGGKKGGIVGFQTEQSVLQFREADYVSETYDTLKALRTSATFVRVATEYELFDSMLIQQVSIQDTEDTGDDAVFRIRFKRVRVVESVTVPVPLFPSGKKPVSAGKKDPQTSTQAGTEKTVAKELLDQIPDKYKSYLPPFLRGG